MGTWFCFGWFDMCLRRDESIVWAFEGGRKKRKEERKKEEMRFFAWGVFFYFLIF